MNSFAEITNRLDIDKSFKLALNCACHKLLLGMHLYFSDNIEARLSDKADIVPEDNLNQCPDLEYNLIKENFEILSVVFKILGYNLIKDYHILSQSDSKKEFFYLEDSLTLKRPKRLIINKKDILILSVIIIETKFGSTFIDEKNLIDVFVNVPHRLTRLKFSEKRMFEVLGRTIIPISISDKKDFVSKTLKNTIELLNEYQYIHRIQSITGNFIISLGAGSFRLSGLFNQMKQLLEEEVN